jgi:hypothetical protein
MKLLFGYDVMTYNGEMPNCLNPKFLNTIYQASDFDFSMSGEHYQKRWNNDWHLYNSNFWNKYVDKVSIHNIIHYEKNRKWFYLIEPFGSIESFFGNHNFYNELALKNISKVALNEIKNGNGNLLINYIIDGGLGMTKPNFQKLIDFTRNNNIPDKKVYLIFQDFRLKRNLEKMGVEYNVFNFNLAHLSKSQEFNNTINNPDYKYWGEKSFEPQVGKTENIINSISSYDEFENSIGSNKVDFLFLCRHWKLHRLLMLSKLQKLGLLFKDNISWDNKFYHQSVVDEFLKHDSNYELANIIKTTSRHLDITDLTKIAGYGFENKEIYLNSYISLVSESIFFQIREEEDVYVEFPSGYLSEKIWKPIGHSQPFILAGPAHSLKYIQSMGYKTFHPYIDESYDNETDDFKRLELILLEMEKFSAKTKEEKDEFLNNVKDICKHNQLAFLQYSKESYKNDCSHIVRSLFQDANNDLRIKLLI